MSSSDDIGDEVEEEDNYDSNMVKFEEEYFFAIPLRGFFRVVVEHFDAAAWGIGIDVPVDFLFFIHIGLTVGDGI